MSKAVAAIRGAVAVTAVASMVGVAEAEPRPKTEVAGGYQLLTLRGQAPNGSAWFPIGWFGEVAVPLSEGITLAGQIDGHYRSLPEVPALASPVLDSRATVHMFLAGARVVGRRDDGLTAFFDLFVGVSRLDTPGVAVSAPFTLRAGGGFDYPLRSRWSARVTAAYLRVSTRGARTQGLSVGVGWVVPIG